MGEWRAWRSWGSGAQGGGERGGWPPVSEIVGWGGRADHRGGEARALGKEGEGEEDHAARGAGARRRGRSGVALVWWHWPRGVRDA